MFVNEEEVALVFVIVEFKDVIPSILTVLNIEFVVVEFTILEVPVIPRAKASAAVP